MRMNFGHLARAARSRTSKAYGDLVMRAANDVARRRGETLAVLDYGPVPRTRWGASFGLPDNPSLAALIGESEERYRRACADIVGLATSLSEISVSRSPNPEQPHWVNGWIPPIDGARLYTLVTQRNPSLYLEVGSGNSTKFVRRAIRDHGLRTRIVSIDPRPRAEVDAICDEVVRTPLENADLEIFSELGPDDVLFVDGSHRALQNSDATVVFLEIVPTLAEGVEFGFHDILLPEDYHPGLEQHWYSEQYLLASYLLGGANGATIEFPARYIKTRANLSVLLDPVWAAIPGGSAIRLEGTSFWMRAAAPRVTPGA